MLRKMKRVVVFLGVIVMSAAQVFADQNVEGELLQRLSVLESSMKEMQSDYQSKISRLSSNLIELQKENKKLKNEIKEEISSQDIIIQKCESSLKNATTGMSNIPAISEGIEIGFGATGIVQGVVNGANGNQGDKVDATWTSDLELTKTFENCGFAYAHIEMGQGSGLDGDEVSFFNTINRDAGDSSSALEVTELYYEGLFAGERFVVTGGKIDASAYFDDNAYANDETSQFLGSTFRNASTIEFPDNNIGLRIGAELFDGMYLNVGVVEGDGDFEDVGDGVFSFAQLAYSADILERAGTYRLYGWHSGNAHEALKDSSQTKEHNYGFGLSLDQELAESVGCFARLAWADPKVSTVEYTWSTGMQFDGNLWNRENDYLGIAVGQNIPGSQYEKSGSTNHKEGQFEVYYSIYLYEHLSVSPHFQVIWNPLGVDEEAVGARSDSLVTIAGLRSQLNF